MRRHNRKIKFFLVILVHFSLIKHFIYYKCAVTLQEVEEKKKIRSASFSSFRRRQRIR